VPSVSAPIKVSKFGETSRPDAWWLQPLLVFLGLSAFIVYSTWAAFQGDYYSHLRGLAPRLVRTQARVVARMATLLARVPHPLGPRRLSPDVLLLSWSLLQSLLGGPTFLCGRGA
jgi:hypothetical protein